MPFLLPQLYNKYEDLDDTNIRLWQAQCPVCCGKGLIPEDILSRNTPEVIEFNKKQKKKLSSKNLLTGIRRTCEENQDQQWPKVQLVLMPYVADFNRLYEIDNKTICELKDFNIIKKMNKTENYSSLNYLLKDARHKKLFCAKTYQKERLHQLKTAWRAIQERRILAAIAFPFVVPYMSSFQGDRFVATIKGYVTGHDLVGILAEHLQSGTDLPDHVIRFFSEQICMVVSFLHEIKVLHRDLTLRSWVIGRDGYLKLVDLGYSYLQLSEEGLKRRETAKIWGMRLTNDPEGLPESRLNQKKSYAQECDWWSVGCNLFQLAMNHRPFTVEGHRDAPTTWQDIEERYTPVRNVENDGKYRKLVSLLLAYEINIRRDDGRNTRHYQVMNDPYFGNTNFSNLMQKFPALVPLELRERRFTYISNTKDPKWKPIQGALDIFAPIAEDEPAGPAYGEMFTAF